MAQPAAAQQFRCDRSVRSAITVLTFRGVVNEGLEGKALASSIKTRKVIVDLRDVRRFASWGMSEWTEFIKVSATRDVHIVECSSTAFNQFNIVTGLLGQAKLISFYVPYRCSTCGEESDGRVLLHGNGGAVDYTETRECKTCGGTARLEKLTQQMTDTAMARPSVDLDDDIVEYLRATYQYAISPDVGRFRAHKRAGKNATYLRLTGDLATLAPERLIAASQGTTVVDLAGVILRGTPPAMFLSWRRFVEGALQKLPSLELLDCPPGFLEHAVLPGELGKVSVRTFAVAYPCAACGTTSTNAVDVASNLEQLVEGQLPAARCVGCKLPVDAAPDDALLEVVRRLPPRAPEPAIDQLIAKARAEPSRLTNALVEVPPAAEPARAGGSRVLYVVAGVLLVVAAAIVFAGMGLWKNKTTATTNVVTGEGDTRTPTSQYTRPDWIVSDVPSTGFCQDESSRVVCVGVSSFQRSRDQGLAEANDAALEELVQLIALKVPDAFFKEAVLPRFSQARVKALAALQSADMDRTSSAYTAASETVRAARKRVVQAFLTSGGPAVPAQRSDWYWEEYAREQGGGTEVLVFVRYDISADSLRVLIEQYGAASDVLGTEALTSFPSLDWQLEAPAAGAMIKKPAGAFAAAGVVAQDVVTAVGDVKILDAASLAKAVVGAPVGQPLKLEVVGARGAARVVDLVR